MLQELERILPGKLGQSASVTERFVALLRAETRPVNAEPPFPAFPDPDDEPIIASALAGQAQVFVTGDKALLELKCIEHLPLISPRQFWELLSGRDKPE